MNDVMRIVRNRFDDNKMRVADMPVKTVFDYNGMLFMRVNDPKHCDYKTTIPFVCLDEGRITTFAKGDSYRPVKCALVENYVQAPVDEGESDDH